MPKRLRKKLKRSRVKHKKIKLNKIWCGKELNDGNESDTETDKDVRIQNLCRLYYKLYKFLGLFHFHCNYNYEPIYKCSAKIRFGARNYFSYDSKEI